MNDKILVTYASRTGSTAGIAEATGKTLAEGDLPVEVLPMQAVRDLTLVSQAGERKRCERWKPLIAEDNRSTKLRSSRDTNRVKLWHLQSRGIQHRLRQESDFRSLDR